MGDQLSRKTIMITGATDGLGLATARALAIKGHELILHGRNPAKLDAAMAEIASVGEVAPRGYIADLSDMDQVQARGATIRDEIEHLDVLINNAGVFKLPANGHSEWDLRFRVNTIAPFVLTKALLPIMDAKGRIINLSSAAQAPVSLTALQGKSNGLTEFDAYAQSKLALTMWSMALAHEEAADQPVIVAINPGSLLATKMVKSGFGVDGNDIQIGVDILTRASLSDEFDRSANGKYYDNDGGHFAPPHQAARTPENCQNVLATLERIASA